MTPLEWVWWLAGAASLVYLIFLGGDVLGMRSSDPAILTTVAITILAFALEISSYIKNKRGLR